MQFLSEPSGGSDVAGALTTAVRDGDEWVLNGSKIWTHRRVVVRLRPVPGPHQLGRAQAPRPQRVHRPDPPARHRAPPDRDDQRLQGVLPGVLHRRPRARRRPRRRGRRGLDGRHPLDVPRAERDGRRLAVRDRDHGSARRGDRRAAIRWSSWPAPTGRLDDPRARELIGEADDAAIGERRRCPSASPPACGTGVFPENSAAIARLITAVVAAAQQHDRAGARRRRTRPPRCPTTRGPRTASTSSSARRRASAAAPPRWPATTSASGSSACPGSRPPTRTCRSATSRRVRPGTELP